MHAAIAEIRTHDTHKLLSAKAAFLRLSPDEKARSSFVAGRSPFAILHCPGWLRGRTHRASFGQIS